MEHGGEPGSQQEVIKAYESLLSRTRHMLDSARDANWSALIDQESTYIKHVDQLKKLEAGRFLDDEHRERKAKLLDGILENDLEIRERLVERREELGKLIGTSQRQRNLRHAYGVGGGGQTPPSDPHFIKRAP